MRLVFKPEELEAQIKTARSEAEHAFGDGELILEKAVINPRHIEIQVFADKQGNAVYLGERDCSIQRRHQKVVEEAPSPFVDEALRKKMGEAAVQAAKACNYVGAGTVEFLVDADKNFYFLEMNTRLQVEHPVTELITGTDLVAWQISVAAGEDLPLTQEQITLTGHAMEVRLYAEDPAQNFMPQTGIIHTWKPAQGEGVRIDSGITASVEIENNPLKSTQSVSPFYDPMLAKIIAYGANREQARRRLIRAVEESTLFGVTVNSHFLGEVLAHNTFIQGNATTAFIADDFGDNPTLSPQKPGILPCALAAIISYLKQRPQLNNTLGLSGWSNTGHAPWPYKLKSDEHEWSLHLKEKQSSNKPSTHEVQSFSVEDGESELSLNVIAISDDTLVYQQRGSEKPATEHLSIRKSCQFKIANGLIYLHLEGAYFSFEDCTHSSQSAQEAVGSGQITASMDGAIIDILAQQGDRVEKGQTLVILEAMKMEHPLKSDVNGTIEAINISKGDQVKLRQLLVSVISDEDSSSDEIKGKA